MESNSKGRGSHKLCRRQLFPMISPHSSAPGVGSRYAAVLGRGSPDLYQRDATRATQGRRGSFFGTFLPIHRQTRLDPSDRFALGHS
jgi:hypothetical protein